MTSDVTRAVDGDREAFGRLVDQHRNVVCAITLAVLGDPGASEDAAQEAFFTAWRELPRLRDPRQFPAWLQQIARNQARMVARASRRRGDRVVVDPVTVAGSASSEPSAELGLATAEETEVVRSALATLSAESREVLVLYYREDRSTSEVARQLLLSDAAVRKRLSRARQDLRAEVEARLEVEVRRSRPDAAFTAAVLASLGSWRSVPTVGSRGTWVAAGGGAAVAALIVLAMPLFASPGAHRGEGRAPRQPSSSVAGVNAPVGEVDVPPAVVLPAARTPVEEALFALATAGRFGVVRCDLAAMEARGVTVNAAFIGRPFDRAEMVAGQVVGVVDAEATDEGKGERTLRFAFPGLRETEAVAVQVRDIAPGALGTCEFTVVPRPPARVPVPVPSDPELDLAVFAEIARFDASARDELAMVERGDDPYGKAIALPGLSAEARALLMQWQEGRAGALAVPMLTDEGRALLDAAGVAPKP